jgi:phenylalanyl-tRNA synthetase beta chain
MRVPLSWLLEYAHLDLPAGPDGAVAEETAREVAARLTAVGLEVETIEPPGTTLSGVVVARSARSRS